MNVFQRYGVMEYGTIYGHGAYLGPDFTAEYLHRSALFLTQQYERQAIPGASAGERVAAELHRNAYDSSNSTLPWSAERAAAHNHMVDYYGTVFRNRVSQGGRQAEWITDPEDVRKLTAFFAWTAWTARPTGPAKTIPTPTTGRPSRWPATR